jgi:hypothetical protein
MLDECSANPRAIAVDYEGIKNFRRMEPGISMADALSEFPHGFSCEIHHPVTFFVYAAREFAGARAARARC